MEDRFRFCFDCLQRRIESDFSEKILFCHGISDSPLPFGSSAVVELSSSSGCGDGESCSSQPQFLVSYFPIRQCRCPSDYVDEYIDGDSRLNVDHTSDGGTTSWKILLLIFHLAPWKITRCSHFSLLIDGKATGRDSLNFLNMIGMPGESTHPGCLRHPNIIPKIGILKSSENINFMLPKVPYTLESILHFSPNTIKSEWDIKLLIYQILSALVYLHGMGFVRGNICPSSIAMTKSFWPLISICDKPGLGLFNHKHTSPTMTTGIVCCENDCACQGLYTDLKLSLMIHWHTEFTKWWKGELSNFEYILILNKLAGRRWGDHTFYPVMPWVIDFSTRPDESAQTGWRDLSKSKWRLAKGDEQLDFTYLTSEVPHHVCDECPSDLAVCSYKARRLPLSILRLAVRSVYEPNEYPSTMPRLYQWTPD